MMWKSLGIHLGLLVVAGGLATLGWLSDEAPETPGQVELWSGKAESLQRLVYRSQQRRVVLDAQRDEQGRFFVAEVESEKSPHSVTDPHADPHAADTAAHAQPAAPTSAAAGQEPAAEREVSRFVSVTEATELAELLGPLRGLRSLGAVDGARAADFGFDAPELAELEVTLEGRVHKLVFGAKTPGGGDQYVKREDNQAYVIDGEIARSLESAQSRLPERDLHEWQPDSATRIKLSAPAGSKELTRAADKKSFWTDPARPGETDETASNWMTKLDRLRVTKYVEAPPSELQVLFKLEYFSEAGKRLGFVELAQVAGAGLAADEKARYLARTEHTRWWGEVIQSTAEQLAQDVDGLLEASGE